MPLNPITNHVTYEKRRPSRITIARPPRPEDGAPWLALGHARTKSQKSETMSETQTETNPAEVLALRCRHESQLLGAHRTLYSHILMRL